MPSDRGLGNWWSRLWRWVKHEIQELPWNGI